MWARRALPLVARRGAVPPAALQHARRRAMLLRPAARAAAASSTTVPDVSGAFDASQRALLRQVFDQLDRNGDGEIDYGDVRRMLKTIGARGIKDADVKRLLASVDIDKNGTVDFAEFLVVVHGLRGGDAGGDGATATDSGEFEGFGDLLKGFSDQLKGFTSASPSADGGGGGGDKK